jgi:hypothetical protein
MVMSVIEARDDGVGVSDGVEADELDDGVRTVIVADLSHLEALLLGAEHRGSEAVDAKVEGCFVHIGIIP